MPKNPTDIERSKEEMNAIDVVIGVLVVGAVIFFGALISIGNERQRKAIDTLKREMADYFMQRLRLERGQASKEISLPDAAAWLSTAFSQAYGENIKLIKDEFYPSPDCLVMLDEAGRKVMFTTLPPDNLGRLVKKPKKDRTGSSDNNPLTLIDKKSILTELTILNTTPLFDLEIPNGWQGLTKQTTTSDKLWAYSKL
jgi:hypothetical protein